MNPVRKSKTLWSCEPTKDGWNIKAIQPVHGIGVRCEVDLPEQPNAKAILPVIIVQMADEIARQKERVLQQIERNHKHALEETETAIEESGKTPTRH